MCPCLPCLPPLGRKSARQWVPPTSRTLAPGQSAMYGLRLLLAPDPLQVCDAQWTSLGTKKRAVDVVDEPGQKGGSWGRGKDGLWHSNTSSEDCNSRSSRRYGQPSQSSGPPPSHLSTRVQALRTAPVGAAGDTGNRASPVGRCHLKLTLPLAAVLTSCLPF